MMRHPVLISSLEDDFRNLGLLPLLQEQSETPKSKDDLPTKKAKPTEEPDKKKVEAAPGEKDGLEERRVAKRVSAGGRRKVRTKRASAGERRLAKKYYRKHKAKVLRGRKKKMKKPRVQRRMAFLARMRGENGDQPQIENLLGEVRELVSSVDGNSRKFTVRSYAQMAIMSEMLSHYFGWVSEDEEINEELKKDLEEAAEIFSQLAEDSAETAKALNSGQLSESDEDLKEDFDQSTDVLMDGLEMYSDLVEDDGEDEDEEDEEEEDDEEEEEGKD